MLENCNSCLSDITITIKTNWNISFVLMKMTNLKIVAVFTLFILAFNSCKKDPNVNPDYFAFGDAHGHCISNCARFFKISNKAIFPDDMERLQGSLKFQTKPLDNSKYEMAKVLEEHFPDFLQKNANQTFGCPDCADQGGYHIEIRQNNVTRFWHIDTNVNEQPAEIRSYIQELQSVISSLTQ